MGEHIAKEGDVVAVGQPICTIETVEQGQANSAWHQGDDARRPAQSETVSVAEQAQPTPAAAGCRAAGPAARWSSRRSASHSAQQAVAAGAQQAAPVAQAQAAPAQPPRAVDNGNGSAARCSTTSPRRCACWCASTRWTSRRCRAPGLEGRISKKDVLDYVQRRDAGGGVAPAPPRSRSRNPPAAGASQAAAAGSATARGGTRRAAGPQRTGSAATAAAPQPASPPPPQPQRAEGDELIPLTPTRRAIAEHMVRSRHTAPHAWLTMEVDMSRVAKLRAARACRVREALRRQADLPALRGARGLRRAAPVPHAQRVVERRGDHRAPRPQPRHRRGARGEPDRAGDPQRRPAQPRRTGRDHAGPRRPRPQPTS